MFTGPVGPVEVFFTGPKPFLVFFTGLGLFTVSVEPCMHLISDLVLFTHLHSERPKQAWGFGKYLSYKSIFQKTIEREMLIRSQTTTPLQICFTLSLYSQVILKSMSVADNTFQSIYNPSYASVHVMTLGTSFDIYMYISQNSERIIHIYYTYICLLRNNRQCELSDVWPNATRHMC